MARKYNITEDQIRQAIEEESDEDNVRLDEDSNNDDNENDSFISQNLSEAVNEKEVNV